MSKSALLVMDVQRAIVDRFADGTPTTCRACGRAIDGARAAGVPVIYVVVGFRAGHPEVSARNKMFGAIAAGGAAGGGFAEGDRNAEIHPDVAPRPGELVITKKRVSAFAGSDLDMVLRAGGIDSSSCPGIATSGVVLSTLRQASDLDFRLSVL